MQIKEIQSGEYTVFMSEGGVSVITDPGAVFYSDVSPPKDMSKITDEQLQTIADEAVKEWEEFLNDMDNL